MADAGEMKIAEGVEKGGLGFELLFAGAEESEEVGLTGLVGFFEGVGLFGDEGEEVVAGFGDEGELGGHVLAGGGGFVADVRGEGGGLEAGAFGGGGFLGDLALVAIPEGERDGEAEADEAGALGALAGDVLLFASGEEAGAEVLPAVGFGEGGFGGGGLLLGLGELEIGAGLPVAFGGEDGGGEVAGEGE